MMGNENLSIGALARQVQCTVPTIRYYESVGLLPRAARQDGGHRLYMDADVDRLTFIRRCREFGFSMEQVRSLASLGQDERRSCLELRDVAATHLTSVHARITELQGLAHSLQTFIATCDGTCAGGPGPQCTILDDLKTATPTCACGPRPTSLSPRGPQRSRVQRPSGASRP